jgi:hypothetical protein
MNRGRDTIGSLPFYAHFMYQYHYLVVFSEIVGVNGFMTPCYKGKDDKVKGLALLYRGKKLEMTDKEEEEQFHTMRRNLRLRVDTECKRHHRIGTTFHRISDCARLIRRKQVRCVVCISNGERPAGE